MIATIKRGSMRLCFREREKKRKRESNRGYQREIDYENLFETKKERDREQSKRECDRSHNRESVYAYG